MSQDAKIAYLEQLLDRAHDAEPEPQTGSDSEGAAEELAAPRRRSAPALPPLAVAPRDAESKYRDKRGPVLYFALLAIIPLISVALWLLAPPRAAFEELVPEEWAPQQRGAPAPAAPAPAASPLAQAPAALRVTSDPEGPFVYIDGTLAGISPYLTDTLTAGWRVVTLSMEGYATRDSLLYLAPATATTLALTLDSLAATPALTTESEPSDAAPESQAAETIERVPTPAAEAAPEPVVEAPPQPVAIETPAEPVPAERPSVSPAPVPATGTLSVLVRPWGSIYVDDVRKAQDTDLRWTADVPVGPHTVRVVHPVLGVQQHTVEVQADEATSLVVDLY